MAASTSSPRLNGWSERGIGTNGALLHSRTIAISPCEQEQRSTHRNRTQRPRRWQTLAGLREPGPGRAGLEWDGPGRMEGARGPGGLWFLNPRATCRPLDPLDRQVREDSTRPEPVLNGAFPLMRNPKPERKMVPSWSFSRIGSEGPFTTSQEP